MPGEHGGSDRLASRWVSKGLVVMQDVPGDTGKFVGQRNGELVSVQPLIHPRRSSLIAGVKAHLLDQHRLAGFRVLSAVCRRRTLASDGGSAEVVSTLWVLLEQ